MESHWNNRYSNHTAAYGDRPNVFFAEQLSKLNNKDNSKSILLPCDGEGRNGVYAAKEGWNVMSFDESEVGVIKSLSWAKRAKVSITSIVADAFKYIPEERFDVLVLIFAHMPEDMREEFHERVISWIKPGGILILEGFHKDQLGLGSGGPKNLGMLYNEVMIRGDFKELNIEILERAEHILDEGPFHQGRAITMQLVARKPLNEEQAS